MPEQVIGPVGDPRAERTFDPVSRVSAWGWAAVVVVGLGSVPAQADKGADAAVLHAEALIAELQGDPGHALELLREASHIDPANREVLLDRARLASAGDVDLQAPPRRDDVLAFLAVPPINDSERALRAEILLRSGDLERAAKDLSEMGGTDAELRRERQQLGEALSAARAGEVDRFRATVLLGSELDTNVTLDPNQAASDKRGGRGVLDVRLAFVPVVAQPGWEISVGLGSGKHFGKKLDTYDWIAYEVGTALSLELGPLLGYASLSTQLVTAKLRKPYLLEGVAHAELLWPAFISPGVYVQGVQRNYMDGNVEGGEQDRDGPGLGAGLLAEMSGERVGLVARLGFQGDFAQGTAQRQRGIDASLVGVLNLSWLEASAGLGFEWRRYDPRATGELRNDRRLMPQVDVRWRFLDWLGLRASWLYIRNVSAGQLDYTRHVATLGVEGRF